MTTSPRYPGSPPFSDSEIDRLLFRGRAAEAEQLTAAILSSGLVVVYGVSGTGKTSLLQAGVFHRLRDADLWPVTVRLNDPSLTPVELIANRMVEQAAADGLELLPPEPAGADLWELLAGLEVWRGDVLLTPVLVLDQFEELFTLDWDTAARERFLTRFGWVTRGHRPLEEGGMEGRPPAVKSVILVREDSLGELEALAGHVPQILRDRFRLVALDLAQAEAAIRGPAALVDDRLDSPPFSFADDAVELTLDFLRTREERGETVKSSSVEPSQLQIICQYVEDVLVGNREGVVVTAADLGGRDGLNRILGDFYARAIAALPDEHEAAALELCETGLINAAGRRLSLEVGEIEAGFQVAEPLLDRLVEQRLLRAEARTGSRYFELSHDSLVRPILDARAARLREEAEARRRRLLRWGAAAAALVFVALVVYGIAETVGDTTVAPALLEEPPQITGMIRNPLGTPINDLTIRVYAPDAPVGSAGTGAPDEPVLTVFFDQTGQPADTGAAIVGTEPQAGGAGDAHVEEFAIPVPAGSYRVRFSAPGYDEQWFPGEPGTADPVEVTGPVAAGTIVLSGAGSITGGVSAAGTTVAVEVLDGEGGLVAEAETSDTYAFDVPAPAQYELRFAAPGFTSTALPLEVFPEQVREVREVVLTVAGETGGEDDVEPAPPEEVVQVSFSVRVNGRDASNPDGDDVPRMPPGTPLKVTYVAANNGSSEIVDVVIEDDVTGAFPAFSLPPGEAQTFTRETVALDLEGQEGTRAGCGDGRPTAVIAATLTGTARLEVARRTETVFEVEATHYCNVENPVVAGVVYRDVDGDQQAGEAEGVPSVQLVLTADGSPAASVVTAVNGRYRFEPPPGEYTLTVTPPAGLRVVSGSPLPLSLAEGDTETLDVELAPTLVRGVVESPAGPVAEVEVTLTDDLGTDLHAVTGEGGTFSFSGVADGEYSLGVFEVVGQMPVTVAGADVDVRLDTAPLPDTAALPDGLFCRDLGKLGYAYPDAYTYWEAQGRPVRMDADANDVPCETVYPASEVGAYLDDRGG